MARLALRQRFVPGARKGSEDEDIRKPFLVKEQEEKYMHDER